MGHTNTHQDTPAVVAVLAELGYEDMTIPQAHFNDDDFYVYSHLTKQVHKQFGHRDGWMAGQYAKEHGLEFARGMNAKWMGLWSLNYARRVA